LATDPKREERIHAFAKSNGWAATIHDLGARVVFKNWRRSFQTETLPAKFYSRSHDAVIRVYDAAGNVIERHEHKGNFKEW
jgi:hypothetical protein